MAALDAGQAVPNVTFKVRADTDWVDVTSDDLFKGKTDQQVLKNIILGNHSQDKYYSDESIIGS